METTLQIKQSHYDRRVPVRLFELGGVLDSGTAEQFQQEVLQVLEAGVHHVLLDLSQLRYVSSAGVRAFHRLVKSLSGRDPDGRSAPDTYRSPHLKLLNPSPGVFQTLEMMGLTLFIDVYDDLEQALASF